MTSPHEQSKLSVTEQTAIHLDENLRMHDSCFRDTQQDSGKQKWFVAPPEKLDREMEVIRKKIK